MNTRGLPFVYFRSIAGLLLIITSASVFARSESLPPLAYEYSEQRERCSDYQINKQALFGDLHVHSLYSFDSYISSQRNDPWDAYRYAKGEPITLPGASGEQLLTAQIGRPLDFTSVTDHAEFLGQINVCTEDASRLGYWWPHCIMTRSSSLWVQLFGANWWTKLGGQGPAEVAPTESFACSLSDCTEAGADVWKRIQQAAEDHYDRSSECGFTTLVGYEYTDSPDTNNMHRNVIYRNAQVTDVPYSTYHTGRGQFPKLWELLRENCIDQENGCDVMSIPHNPNLAGGLMFRDPRNETELNNRLFFEPVVELTQHKGASECRFDRLRGLGLQTEDEFCDFEQVVADNLSMLGSVLGKVRTDRAKAVDLEQFANRNMVRNALKDGLMLEQRDGTNPFTMGFIGSTDTHSATPGAAEEDNYLGHLGRRDSEYRNVQDHFFSNPGGHAVVWAEENSRDAIFNAIERRETYATSGTRPIVRFFGGYDLPADLCDSADMVEQGYAHGVPMGGELRGDELKDNDAVQDSELSAEENSNKGPSFLISARKDAGTDKSPGTDLQRLQIIKGWVDAEGTTHERVFDVAGNADNGAGVNPDNCARTGSGASQLCKVWRDPEFDAGISAFYYVRVLENPSCRWSTLQCQAAGVNPLSESCVTQAQAANELALDNGAEGEDIYGKCCLDPEQQPFYSPIIQERAWTSPIWYQPVSSL